MGGAAEEPKIIESATKAPQIDKSSNNSSTTKDAPVSSHNPFNILIDPMSNVPERPFIPPIEKVNDIIAELESKNIKSSTVNSTIINKDEKISASEIQETVIEKDNIVSDPNELVACVV